MGRDDLHRRMSGYRPWVDLLEQAQAGQNPQRDGHSCRTAPALLTWFRDLRGKILEQLDHAGERCTGRCEEAKVVETPFTAFLAFDIALGFGLMRVVRGVGCSGHRQAFLGCSSLGVTSLRSREPGNRAASDLVKLAWS